jgi:methylmalonyl-CoA mutase
MNVTEEKPATEPQPERLLADFPPVTYDQWRRLVESELKGAPFDKRMFSATYEGIALKPIYCAADTANLPLDEFPGAGSYVRGTSPAGYVAQPWAVSQEITCSSPSEFNHEARNSIAGGLNALNMVLDKATRNGRDPDWALPEEVGSGGLSIATLRDLERALEGIDLKHTVLFVRSGASGMPFATLLVALLRKHKLRPNILRACIETDPLGVLSHEGVLPQSMAGAYREMAALTRWASDHAPQVQTICVHSRAWHEAGGNAVQELAFTLATGVEYLRQMNLRELDVNIVGPRIRFAVTVGENFFIEIAKLRALRQLWSRAVSAIGGNEEAQKLTLHVRTSQWNKSVCDPHTNILRATVEALAGVLGGCDSLQVGAFDEVVRPPDDFSRRVARNTQLVLQKECNLTHVIDPAGGSWYVESLTAELAARAWTLFQEVEVLGGMEAALRAGLPQKSIDTVAAAKKQAVARRRDSIVGVSQYANPAEKPLDIPFAEAAAFHKRRAQQIVSHRTSMDDADSEVVLKKLSNIVNIRGEGLFAECLEAVSAGATLGEIVRAIRIHDHPCAPVSPVNITRAAIPFEKLRTAVDREVAAGRPRPQVFLCNMGSLKEHKARADFSRGFFAAGGYEVISPKGFPNAEAAVKAFAESGAHIAVICSIDENYPTLVPLLVQGIRAAQAGATIALAGYPLEQVETYRKAGVDEFVHIRADVAVVLASFHHRLGIEL